MKGEEMERKLKNGSMEHTALIAATMLTLENCMRDAPMSFCEFAMMARDKEHQVTFPGILDDLKARGLIQGNSGTMHDSIRNIAVSAIEGDGLDMTVVSPIAKE